MYRELKFRETGTILHSRFVLTIKNHNKDSEYLKTRLVVLGHRDPEKPRIVNEASTVLKSSERLLISLIFACGFPLWSRDITLAFLQSKDKLKLDVYVRPSKGEDVSKIIGVSSESRPKPIKPHYGLAEAPGNYWRTFRDWRTSDLGVKVTALDLCLFYKLGNNGLEGLQVTKVDDTYGGGSSKFSLLETTKSFQSIRGNISYVSTCTRPDLSYLSARLSRVSPECITKDDCALFNPAVAKLQAPLYLAITKLDELSLYLAGYADASIANNPDLTLQLGFIDLLKDKDENATIIHYGSLNCRRVTRSVLGAEVYAFNHYLDYLLALAHDISSIIDCKIKTVMFTDSKSLFDTITKLSTVSEKRLLIDISAICENYTTRDLSNIAHVRSNNNIANILTNTKTGNSLHLELMSSARLSHPISQWIIPQ